MPPFVTLKADAIFSTTTQWDSGAEPDATQVISLGTKVEYAGHIVGGMLKVRYKGQDVIIHPGATVELS